MWSASDSCWRLKGGASTPTPSSARPEVLPRGEGDTASDDRRRDLGQVLALDPLGDVLGRGVRDLVPEHRREARRRSRSAAGCRCRRRSSRPAGSRRWPRSCGSASPSRRSPACRGSATASMRFATRCTSAYCGPDEMICARFCTQRLGVLLAPSCICCASVRVTRCERCVTGVFWRWACSSRTPDDHRGEARSQSAGVR